MLLWLLRVRYLPPSSEHGGAWPDSSTDSNVMYGGGARRCRNMKGRQQSDNVANMDAAHQKATRGTNKRLFISTVAANRGALVPFSLLLTPRLLIEFRGGGFETVLLLDGFKLPPPPPPQSILTERGFIWQRWKLPRHGKFETFRLNTT